MTNRMTCQCCGKKYLANVGSIAHHGYQRPGGGWQTASCMGAKYAPFEVSRDRLADLIKSLNAWEARAVSQLAEIEAETVPVSVTVRDYDAPIKRDAYGRRPTKEVSVTRENFDAVKSPDFRTYSLYNFDDVKARDVRVRTRDIENIRAEIAAQVARFEGWAQTHTWEKATKTWAVNPA